MARPRSRPRRSRTARRSPSVVAVAAARGVARQLELGVDRLRLVAGEALLALLQHADRALRVPGQSQRTRVFEQRVGARADLARALAQLDRPCSNRQGLLVVAGLVEFVGLELERSGIAVGDRLLGRGLL